MHIRAIIYTGGEEKTMTYSELKKLLKKNGCYLDHEGKRHEIWYSPITGEHFPLGRHKTEEVKNGTLNQSKRVQELSNPCKP